MRTESKCDCQRCGEHIAFPNEMVGQTIECPHCKGRTVLFIPSTAQAPVTTLDINNPETQKRIKQLEHTALFGVAGVGGRLTMKGVNDILRVHPDDRITITPHGLMGLWSKGLKGEKTILISSLTAIQFKRAGFTTGYLQFTFPGSHESHGGLLDAGTDENTFMFYSKVAGDDDGNKQAEEIKNYIERRIRELRSPAPTAAPSASLADELAKLVALKTQGALSEEEFIAAKKRLLS